MDPDITQDALFPISRRELAVLAVVLAVVIGAVLLLVITSSHLASALFGSG